MLDDLKYIHEKDAADTLGIAEKQGEQLLHDFEVMGGGDFKNVYNVVYGGMGGSALAPSIVNVWPKLGEPFEIVRDYDIPAYVDGDTLFIAASYSGNTEETLSALAQAEAKGAQIAVIAGGGKLAAIAEEKGYMLLKLPKVEQPRYAVLYNLKALLLILEKAGLLQEDFRPVLEAAAQHLNESTKAWRADVPTAQNGPKQLAQELAGKSVVVYGGPKLFLEIVRDYDIPAYVDGDTLFIAASYSGNTEETLSALAQAEAKGAQIAVIAGGGKLAAIAEEKGYMLLKLPKVEQPRYAVLYNLKALLLILEKAGLLQEDFRPVLEAAAQHLNESTKAWRADVPTAQNGPKQLAQELAGKSVVVYGGPKLFPAAYKWKISFNENAKQVAWCNQIPEFNHNEFIGWSQQPVDKPYAVVDLRSSLEHERVQKRFAVTERLLSGMRPAPHAIESQGSNALEHILWAVAYGDFTSLYLGILNGLNPAPVDLVEKFKKEMDA